MSEFACDLSTGVHPHRSWLGLPGHVACLLGLHTLPGPLQLPAREGPPPDIPRGSLPTSLQLIGCQRGPGAQADWSSPCRGGGTWDQGGCWLDRTQGAFVCSETWTDFLTHGTGHVSLCMACVCIRDFTHCVRVCVCACVCVSPWRPLPLVPS